MKLKGANVLVFGTGISGIAAADLLINELANVIIYDGNDTLDTKEIVKKLTKPAVNVILGELKEDIIQSLDLVVLSPGVPLDNPLVVKLKTAGIKIIGEIELAYRKEKGSVLALTGTNGKTTTTTLLGEIMKAHFEEVYVVGNIGEPYTISAQLSHSNSFSVAELSSFQLETIEKFKPKVSCLLNLTPDHLNRHHTMEAYIEAKQRIAINQEEEDFCILNYEEQKLVEFGKKIKAKVLYFSSQRKLEKGMYVEKDKIIINLDTPQVFCAIKDLKLLGIHNYENVMAASLMAIAVGVPVDTISKVVCEYQGVAHRIEFVCENKGVCYYNDSKGTNPDAAIKAVEAMVKPTILIGGGYDKDSDFTQWIESFQDKVTHLFLSGDTKNKIAKTAQRCGFHSVELCDTFEESVLKAKKLAKEGDVVLLSPACASWGQFINYEERGDKFKEIVKSK